ncbi:MAG TPA: GNAT family N-acetyltransferase [Baekduia sp.]|nr:GNAT family N-acetyltransferase [Baekduia sp.]
MRAYCDWYGAAPSDAALEALSRALLADPGREGFQLLARDLRGRAVGFATVFWTWSTLRAARVGTLNDLYVAEHARGSAAAERLVREALARVRDRGAVALEWQTAPDNARAQRFYERLGAERSSWLDYSLPA